MLEKNNGLKSIFTIRHILNGNNVDEDFPNITPGEVTKFKYAKITSCDVERSYSKYNNLLKSNRRSFTFENHHVIMSSIHLNSFNNFRYNFIDFGILCNVFVVSVHFIICLVYFNIFI